MTAHLQSAWMIVLTIVVYLAARRIYLRFKHPLLNIVVWSSAALIFIFVVCDIPYSEYISAGKLLSAPLGPATVGLAVPLYRYRRLLRSRSAAIIAGVSAGTLLSMILAGMICKYAGLPWEVVVSMMPKGASIPFAVEISRACGGIPALSAAFVAATGTGMAPLCVMLLNRARISDPPARGLALGTVSHAQGVALSLMENPHQAAMSALAMILAGLFTAGFALPVCRLLQSM